MLKFKQKALPPAQLLRWANWFSQWSFDVVHVKWKNITPSDFLSRLKKEINPISFDTTPSFPMIFEHGESSSQ